MKQIIDSRIGLLVLLLSCFLCGNSLPVPAARVHTSAARSAAQQEELQNDNSGKWEGVLLVHVYVCVA